MSPQQFRETCRALLGLPYVWGANGPEHFDCSGLVQHLLARLALDPPGDQTAQDLYRHFQREGAEPASTARLGTLLFFGKPSRIGHVALALDAHTMIEAAGGGPEVTSPEIAQQVGAMVVENPIRRRRDLVSALTPDALPWERAAVRSRAAPRKTNRRRKAATRRNP